jgi:hypothetical protein
LTTMAPGAVPSQNSMLPYVGLLCSAAHGTLQARPTDPQAWAANIAKLRLLAAEIRWRVERRQVVRWHPTC